MAQDGPICLDEKGKGVRCARPFRGHVAEPWRTSWWTWPQTARRAGTRRGGAELRPRISTRHSTLSFSLLETCAHVRSIRAHSRSWQAVIRHLGDGFGASSDATPPWLGLGVDKRRLLGTGTPGPIRLCFLASFPRCVRGRGNLARLPRVARVSLLCGVSTPPRSCPAWRVGVVCANFVSTNSRCGPLYG